MRSILAAFVLVLLPSLASAECICTCVRGQPTAICRPQALVEPICRQICVDKIEQSLGQLGGGGGGGIATTGGQLGASVGAGAGSGVNTGTLEALSR